MTARYLGIEALQEPFDLSDATGRARFAFNLVATRTASLLFTQELAQILIDAGVADEDEIYWSRMVDIPPSGSVIILIETAGLAPMRTHNETLPPYRRSGAQINAYADASEDAKQLANAAYDALAAVVNTTVTTS